ncbi:MAG TPA: hypothetical protein VNL70_06605 [Tepidisphaeraceae bacterium]|nr:hypothetical protein [Tepidisphaeraceae bacterium]
MTQQTTYTTSSGGGTTTFVTPFDRVRWGPILAGLFAALSTLTVLSVLGLAIGLSAWDPAQNIRAWSWGAGIWSILSALISFLVGGWIAARSAATVGERNGLLNGAMVWAVAIPLLLFLLGGGFASLAQIAVAGSDRQVVYLDRSGQTLFDRARMAAGTVDTGDTTTAAEQSQPRAVTPPSEKARRDAAVGAWWTLISLVLGLCAAAVGGLTGARMVGQTGTTSASGTSSYTGA